MRTPIAASYLPAPAALLDRALLVRHLRSLDLRPTKALGQNFLVDPAVLAETITAAELQPTDVVVEVGPGPGVLTAALLHAAGWVIAVEVDRRMLDLLAPLRARNDRLTLLEANVLGLDPARLTDDRPFKVVANLPYYITSAAIRHFLSADHRPELLVLMLQREVAERICAQPGAMSLLAVSVQLFAQPEIVVTVPRTSFYPVPKVESALLRLRVRPEPLIPPEQQPRFFRLVRAGFHDRRKQLHNAFERNLGADHDVVTGVLADAEISPDRRAETLSLNEWARLADALARREA